MSFDVFPVDWAAGDVGDGDERRYTVTMFGKLPDGRSACVHIAFFPYFFVELPTSWSSARHKLFLADMAKHGCVAQYTRVVDRIPMWGFTATKKKAFAQLAFPTLAAFKSARYKLAKDYQTYEAAVDPVVRLFHVRGVKPAAWVRVARSSATAPNDSPDKQSVCDVEVSCSFVDIGPSALTTQPPLVLASEFGFWAWVVVTRVSKRCSGYVCANHA